MTKKPPLEDENPEPIEADDRYIYGKFELASPKKGSTLKPLYSTSPHVSIAGWSHLRKFIVTNMKTNSGF
ncbi:hypothetical protein FIM04_04885 [SAR202 cluster bacterium AC-409-J13_OGT_754m]|nr:hypothetical protein [SAR202 cluster bacterium AC-409-J13_OGT_754m]